MPHTRKARLRSGIKRRGGGWFSSSKKNYNIGKPKAPRIPWHITGETQANNLKKAMRQYKNEMENWTSKTKRAASGSYEAEINKLKDEKDAMEKAVRECNKEVERLKAAKATRGNRFGLSNNTSKLRIRIPKNNNWNNSLSGSSGYTPRSVSSLNRKYKKD